MTTSDAPTKTDTIVAIATPAGRGGVGIVRISGPQAQAIGDAICGITLLPRHAHYCDFCSPGPVIAETIDQGIALFFAAPHSFTGEHVVELQGHGGPVVIDMLLREVIAAGARLARPGEFSERAYLNDKLDLSQAEAIADLINSSSEQAARSALHSLQGEFSRHINELLEDLVKLRVFIEAAIDFPEEEIDFIASSTAATDLDELIDAVQQVLGQAKQGSLLREGMTVVIAGKPNAGKSSLLNALAQRDTAIVSDIAGTTRDVLREYIHVDGMPLHIIDTAGLREQAGQVEQIGIERAWQEIRKADRVLLVSDSGQHPDSNVETLWPEFLEQHGDKQRITLVRNKCDQSGLEAGLDNSSDIPCMTLSAKTGQGMPLLTTHLKQLMGYTSGEGQFSARRRHLDALQRTLGFLQRGRQQLDIAASELLADELRCAQQALGEVTGEFRADDLLGEIFSSFCIGK